MMKNKRALSLVLLPLLLVPIAYATEPSVASGTFTASVTVTSISSADGNTIINVATYFTFAGTLSGTFVGTERDVIHPDGTLTFQGSGTFTGTVAGSGTGTAAASYVGTGVVGVAGGSYQGQFVLGQGTGGLAGLHGQGTYSGAPSAPISAGTYSGQIHFD